MDQVGLTDVDGTMGIGNFRYAIVLCKVKEDYWTFHPLKTLSADEADLAFRQFCGGWTTDLAKVLVYCDAHGSLVSVCDSHNVLRRHPPPGRPQANAIIERKIGVALCGLRAMLVTGCLPNCFWPFAGHAFALNDCIRSGAYEAIHEVPNFQTFAPGELVFFKHPPFTPQRRRTTLFSLASS